MKTMAIIKVILHSFFLLLAEGCVNCAKNVPLVCKTMHSDIPLHSAMDFNCDGWMMARHYDFRPASYSGDPLQEGGFVSILWTDRYLFIRADVIDSDIVQECDSDGEHLYRSGDVLEVFIKPAGGSSYWELYAAPNQRKSSFFFPSRGRILPNCFKDSLIEGLSCKVEIDGTLNDWHDKDKGWRVIMAIPLHEIEMYCGSLDFKTPWLIQVARYNYSCYLDKPELSQIGVSMLQHPDFHDFASYAKLEFVK